MEMKNKALLWNRIPYFKNDSTITTKQYYWRKKKTRKTYKCSSAEPQNSQLEINQVPAIMLSYALLIENFQRREQKQTKFYKWRLNIVSSSFQQVNFPSQKKKRTTEKQKSQKLLL